jgi:hypothetical protein
MSGWFSINRASLAFGGALGSVHCTGSADRPCGRGHHAGAGAAGAWLQPWPGRCRWTARRPALCRAASVASRWLALLDGPARLLACCARRSRCSGASARLHADLGQCRGRRCVVNGVLARPLFACPDELPNRCHCRPSGR